MSTNDQKIVVANDVTPEMMARIKTLKGDEPDENIVFEQPQNAGPEADDINIDFTKGGEPDQQGGAGASMGADPNATQAGGGGTDPQGSGGDGGDVQGQQGGSDDGFDKSPFVDFLKAQGVEDEDEYLDRLFKNKSFKVKMGGKEREMPYSDIKSVLARGTTFQKKYNELENSDEYRFGVLMKAAQEGNAEAQKALKQKLIEFTGTDDADAMLDKLEDVEGEYDLEDAFQKRKSVSEEDAYFSEVKDDVDYQKNIDIIQNDMKGFMPPKIWKAFWDAPEDRRAMYDLAATGKVKEINDLFQSHLQTLPLEKQLEIESDPDLYGRAFITVTNRVVNGQKSNQAPASSTPDTSNISQVSDGSRGRTARAKGQSVPDFLNMPREEFLKWRRENGLDH